MPGEGSAGFELLLGPAETASNPRKAAARHASKRSTLLNLGVVTLKRGFIHLTHDWHPRTQLTKERHT